MIEATPPTLLSLHTVPNKIPIPKKNNEVISDNKIEYIISIFNS